MPTTYKILGQSAPSATTSTDLYTVPSSTQTVVSSIVIANRSSTSATFRISCAPDGASVANSQYIAYDVTVGAADSTVLTLGLTLGDTDKIRVYASTADLTFSAFGSEITA
jgi:glucose-6-phosphate dehydrogenase assembly protein OpcA